MKTSSSIATLSTVADDASCDSGNVCSPTTERKQQVQFEYIEVREYDQILGDNPACRCGPPISLGWTYGTEWCVSVEEYESGRDFRRKRKHLYLTPVTRHNVLTRRLGYSPEDVKRAEDDVRLIQRNRKRTAKLNRFMERAFVLRHILSSMKRTLSVQGLHIPKVPLGVVGVSMYR